MMPPCCIRPSPSLSQPTVGVTRPDLRPLQPAAGAVRPFTRLAPIKYVPIGCEMRTHLFSLVVSQSHFTALARSWRAVTLDCMCPYLSPKYVLLRCESCRRVICGRVGYHSELGDSDVIAHILYSVSKVPKESEILTDDQFR